MDLCDAAKGKFFRRCTLKGVTKEEFETRFRFPNSGRRDREDDDNPGRIQRWVRCRDGAGKLRRYRVIFIVVVPQDDRIAGEVQVISVHEH